jgi:phage-related minor tail protein
MTDNTNRVQVEIGADTSGVEAGAARARSAVESVAQAATSAAQAVGAAGQGMARAMGDAANAAASSAGAISNAYKGTESATRDLTQTQHNLLSVMRERLETQHLDPAGLLRYKAAQAGVSEQMEPLIARMLQAKAATDAKAASDAAAAAAAHANEQSVKSQAAAAQQYLSMLQERVETQHLDPAGLLRYKAAQLGVGEQANHLIGQLHATGKAGEISAGQMNAAMRTVPAQMTDIATQLAGGQNPLLILLQQGGQMKDSFGGIGPMFRGLASMLTPMTLAIGGIAAVLSTLAFAMHEGSAESKQFAADMRNTGNMAGLTEDKFRALGAAAAQSSSSSIGAGRDAAAAAVKSGEFGAESIGSITKAIASLSKATGASADEAGKTFAGITKDASKWAREQNEKFHFLTSATYDHIRALQAEGREQEAAAVAADALARRLDDQPAKLGYIDRALKATGEGWSSFWDKAKGIGKAETVGDQLDELAKKLKRLDENKPTFGGIMGQRATADWERERAGLLEKQGIAQEQQRIEAKGAAIKAEDAKTQKEAIDATERLRTLHQANTPAEKRKEELGRYDRDVEARAKVGEVIDPKQQAADRRTISEKYKDDLSIPSAQADLRLAQAKADSDKITRQLDVEAAQIEQRYKAGLIGTDKYETERNRIKQSGLAERARLIQTEIGIETSRATNTATGGIAKQQKLTGLRDTLEGVRSEQVTTKLAAQGDTAARERTQGDQIGTISVQEMEARALARIDIEQDAARREQQIGKLSQQTLLTQEIEFEERRKDAKRTTMEANLAATDKSRDPVKVRQIEAQIEALEQQHVTRVAQIRSQVAVLGKRESDELGKLELQSWEQRELTKVTLEEEEMKRRQTLGMVTKSVLLQQEEVFEQRRQAIKAQAMEANLAAIDPASDPVKYRALKNQIEEAERQHQIRMAQIRGQAAMQSAAEQGQIWKSLNDRMGDLWEQGMQATIQGTLTAEGARKAIIASGAQWFAKDVVGAKVKAWWAGEQAQTIASQTGQATRDAAVNSPAAFMASIGKRLSAWIFGESAQTAGTVAGVTARTTAEGTGAASSVAINSGKAITNIGTSALEAMAGAWTAMVSIPYIGPVLAVGAAAAAFAGVSALAGRVKSARGGYDIPSDIDPITQLHREEMVLPREHANTIRGMGKNGGAGKDGSTSKDGASAAPQPVSVTYNDHSGRLSPDDLRRNARVIGDIVAQRYKDNGMKLA